jgi:hypothetical protein
MNEFSDRLGHPTMLAPAICHCGLDPQSMAVWALFF